MPKKGLFRHLVKKKTKSKGASKRLLGTDGYNHEIKVGPKFPNEKLYWVCKKDRKWREKLIYLS
jgi:hypothetical protein